MENPEHLIRKIRTPAFCTEYKALVGQRKIEDRHYYYGDDKDHRALSQSIAGSSLWTIILYGNAMYTKDTHRDLPVPFRRLPVTWEQLFFVGDKERVTIYRGNPLGSGYRFTHGIMANAFALLNRRRAIATFMISQGRRGGLSIHKFTSLRVHGHDLIGNYHMERSELDENIPEEIRVYGHIRSAKMARTGVDKKRSRKPNNSSIMSG